MAFYAINGKIIYKFIYRRISKQDECENSIKKEYYKLAQKASTIRIVGISPLPKEENYLIKQAVPDKLKRPIFLQNWTFVRLENQNACLAYFDSDCQVENYWAGLFPQK